MDFLIVTDTYLFAMFYNQRKVYMYMVYLTLYFSFKPIQILPDSLNISLTYASEGISHDTPENFISQLALNLSPKP